MTDAAQGCAAGDRGYRRAGMYPEVVRAAGAPRAGASSVQSETWVCGRRWCVKLINPSRAAPAAGAVAQRRERSSTRLAPPLDIQGWRQLVDQLVERDWVRPRRSVRSRALPDRDARADGREIGAEVHAAIDAAKSTTLPRFSMHWAYAMWARRRRSRWPNISAGDSLRDASEAEILEVPTWVPSCGKHPGLFRQRGESQAPRAVAGDGIHWPAVARPVSVAASPARVV